MEIRPLAPEDEDEYIHIASQAFRWGERFEFGPGEFLPEGRYRLGAFENGRLQAQYTICDFALFFGPDQRPCGGIAGVACEPSARGRGNAGALIDRSLEVMRERGQYLSLLWPFSYPFYRAFGWEWTGYGREYSVKLDLLPTSREAEFVEPVFSDPFETLNPIYERQATRYHGAMVRSPRLWEQALKPHGKREAASYIYRRDGAAEGFAVLRYPEDEKGIRASDLVALTPPAYLGLLTLLKRHAAKVERAAWSAPMDDPLWNLVQDWRVKTKVSPIGMGRIVDLEPAIAALVLLEDLAGSAVVSVTDAHAPWNQGTWRFVAEGGGARIARSHDTAGIRMSIQALTQAYWGTPSLLDLRRAGQVDVQREADFDLFSKLLPPTPVWLADDF